MNRTAQVTSLEALDQFRAALLKFQHDARDGLTMLVLEVRRAVDWLEQDRRRYWPAQVRRASDRLVEARNALERCQLRYGSEDPPPCREQKKAYEAARRRARYCEEKVQATRHWTRVLRNEVKEFDGQIAKMTGILDSDLPRAVAALERMLAALERYAGRLQEPTTSADPDPPPRQENET